MAYRKLYIIILALTLTGCAKSETVVEEPMKVQEASSEEETKLPLSNGGNSLDAMMLEDYKLPEIPDDKLYLVDNLILPSRQEVYYELPYEGYELPESTADSIITELTKLCIYKGYSKCSMVDAALDTGTINYRFKCDDTDWYNLYLYFESYDVLIIPAENAEPYDLALADDERKVGGSYFNRDISLGNFEYSIPVSELDSVTALSPLDFYTVQGFFDEVTAKAIQYFADTYIVEYDPEVDFNVLTDAYLNISYDDFHTDIIEIKGVPYAFTASDDNSNEYIYVNNLE